LYNPEEARSWA
jgi:DNA-directed RNA polymerase subunit F